ncbi:MAG: ComF family protein [Pseudomonadota bacterium]
MGVADSFSVKRRQVSGGQRSIVNLKSIFQVDRWLYPPVCLVCGLEGRKGLDCCEPCQAELPMVSAQCRRCGLELVRNVELCGRCSQRLPYFDSGRSAFAYRGAVEALIQRFKFGRDLAAGRVLSALMAEQVRSQDWPPPQLMVPVPLHRGRRWLRGFNQSEMLCRDLSKRLGDLPWSSVLQRRRATRAQSELPADRRRGNVRGAFQLKRLPPDVRHIALVDDVMTTGSTLDECARVLKRAGVERVDLWVLARA